MANKSDLMRETLKEYDKMVDRLSNGYPLFDPMPIIKRMIMIDLMSQEDLQDNYINSIIQYYSNNEHFKK